ncbi:MAG: HAMP domain-containing protein [Proteobacteria bacterium]|nr:HAMP domain-containing protein [Pseudomonadota bacterium]
MDIEIVAPDRVSGKTFSLHSGLFLEAPCTYLIDFYLLEVLGLMPKMSIKTKIMAITLLVAFIPGVIGVASIYIKGTQVFEKSIGDEFLNIAKQASRLADTLIEKEISEIDIISKNTGIINLIAGSQYAAGEIEHILKASFSSEQEKAGHSNIGIYDSKGGILYSFKGEEKQALIEPESLLMMKEGRCELTAGKIYINSEQHFAMPLYAPICRSGEKLEGIVALTIDFFELMDGQLGDSGMGSTGHINIVSSDGTILYDPLTPRGGSPFSRRIMQRVAKERDGWFVDIDEHGLNSVIAFSPLGLSGHEGIISADDRANYLILTQEEHELFIRPVRDVLFSAAVPGFTFASFLIFAVYLVLRKTVQPISTLKEGVAVIGRGDLDFRIDIETGDEIEELANEFNNMASELKNLYAGLEQKVSERTMELEISNRDLEKASRMKSEFLANMSHELRTPLNSILGFSEILVDQIYGETNEKQSKYLRNIQNSGKHLLEVINDILDLSKIESGKMELIKTEFPLIDAVEEVYSALGPLAHKKDIKMSSDVSNEGENIYADHLKLKQVIYNLVGNAIKFTPEGGSISLEATRHGNEMHISVSDTGVGIEESNIDLIFEAFMQADTSHSRNFEGTGLGLALSKRFIEMHGGRISVKSKLGEGSTFSFYIPMDGKSEHSKNLDTET